MSAITGKTIESVDAAGEFGDYEDWLMEQIDKFAIEILPYPGTTTKELVTKSYEGKRPFKESGAGHKDYLIWRTIVTYLECQQAVVPTYFLTNNKTDFCTDGPAPFSLHPGLTSQLAEGRPLNVYLDVGTFFSDMIDPHLKGLDINAIPDDLVDHVFEFIEQNLTNYSAYAFEGVPFRSEVRIRCVNNVDILAREIKSLDEDEVVVTFDCECDVELDGFMEKHEYFSGDHDIDVWDPDWNDWVMAVSTDARLPVRALFTYSKREGGITGSNVEFPTEYSDNYH